MILYLPLLTCIIGACFYALSDNPKVQKLAGDAFWCGLLVTLYVFATKPIHLG